MSSNVKRKGERYQLEGHNSESYNSYIHVKREKSKERKKEGKERKRKEKERKKERKKEERNRHGDTETVSVAIV